MFQGFIYALAACFIWGLIFIVPQFMSGFSAIEVAIGRYLVYSIISLLIFFKAWLQKKCRYPRWVWLYALGFSFTATMGYYTCVVLSLRYASASICALILGISPIVIAFYGNWKQKEISFKSLILPSILIAIGLVIINAPHLYASTAPSSYLLGLFFSLCALIQWSWYVVANSRFLCRYTQVSSSDWSTLMGVASLFWILVFGGVMALFFSNQLHVEKYFVFNSELKSFLLGSMILGLFCSWIGAFLWNQASLRLPISLAGQLTIFETIFGVVFVFILERALPSMMEGMGMAILLMAIIYGIKTFSRQQSSDLVH